MSEMAQDTTESGGVVTADDEDVVGVSEHDVPSSSNDKDNNFVCDELEATKESREENHNVDNNAIKSTAVMVDDEPAAEDQTTELHVGDQFNANADIEPSRDDTEDIHSADVGEEPVLIGDNDVIPPDESTEDGIPTPGPDDDSDATEDYSLSSPDEPVDVKADNMQHVQTDKKDEKDTCCNDARNDSDDIAVNDESSHESNTTRPERELLSLDRDKDSPTENDEEMARFPVNIDDMIEEAYPGDQPPTRRYRALMLVACIAAMAIIAAVVVTSVNRGTTEESLSSFSSSTVTITENDGRVDTAPSSSIPSYPSNIQEPPSIQPSFDPSAPSSQYQWLQNAIDNYVGTLQEEAPNDETDFSLTSLIPMITHNPSSKPIANATPPPSTANPTTFKPTTATPTTSNSTLSTSPPTASPTMQPTTADPTAIPTSQPSTASPTLKPSMQPVPNVTELSSTPPTATSTMQPPLNISEFLINEANPTQKPSVRPTPQQRKGCITNNIYDEIDRDIELLKNGISDDKTKAHFLGGIVRLVAHDFMDFDRNDANNPMGPDGCFDPFHPANAGLPDDLWCDGCLLTNLYLTKYSEHQISRADFWIASANAVIRQTSVNNGLDLRDTFEWGRVDANSCGGQGDRIPSPRGCSQTEDVFLTRMGLTWTDATALMGAHTLGRGDTGFSGHHGTWVPSNIEAMSFDKTYYEEVFLNSWHPQNIGTPREDWTTGNGGDRVMLNTDLCLVMLIDENMPCCTGTRCTGLSRRCPRIPANHPRSEAFDAFEEYLGGSYPNENQQPFYDAFREAWRKATKVGQNNLFPLADNCDVDLFI